MRKSTFGIYNPNRSIQKTEGWCPYYGDDTLIDYSDKTYYVGYPDEMTFGPIPSKCGNANILKSYTLDSTYLTGL